MPYHSNVSCYFDSNHTSFSYVSWMSSICGTPFLFCKYLQYVSIFRFRALFVWWWRERCDNVSQPMSRCLPTPLTLASGWSTIVPLVFHQPTSPSICSAVSSPRRGLSTNQVWQRGAYVRLLVQLKRWCVLCVWVLERGHSGDECDLVSTLCKYDLRKEFFFVLRWARVWRVRREGISSELIMWGGGVRRILLLPIVTRCIVTIDVCIWRRCVFMSVVVDV